MALSADQVREYSLPVNPGKVSDSRSGQFIARHGELVQVELDALDPDDMRGLFQDKIDHYWDESAYEAVRTRGCGQAVAQRDRSLGSLPVPGGYY